MKICIRIIDIQNSFNKEGGGGGRVLTILET